MKAAMKGVVAAMVMAIVSAAATAAPPTLEISGNLSHFTDTAKKSYKMSETEFLSLPQSTIKTGTNWTPVSRFTGVKITDVLDAVGAKGDTVEFRTLDDYTVQLPIAEFRKYGVILARYIDGKPLDPSKWGPYFVIYPKDDFPAELNVPTTEAKFIWQVTRLIVR